MKVLVILFAMFSFLGFSQEKENSIYFPQEQLIHPECKDFEDTNTCLEKTIEQQVFALLNEKKSLKAITNGKKDTLSIRYRLLVTNEGVVKKEFSQVYFTSAKKYKKIKENLNETLKNFPKFEVLNRKSEDLKSNHFLNFKYQIVKGANKTILNLIPNKKKYSGGVIETIPQYPGCGIKNDLETRKCFNQHIQNHIAQNFRYPIEAQNKRIQGKVYTMFTIMKDSSLAKIRTRGPHSLLEKEAVRLVKLLPKIAPGTQNGKPVKVPFSIPINFRLK